MSIWSRRRIGLPALVDVVLPQQHQHGGQQFHDPLFQDGLLSWLIIAEPFDPL